MRSLLAVLLLQVIGCAHAPAPAPAARSASPRRQVRLAILPVEGQGLSGLARALNHAMSGTKIEQATETIVSKVPLEVVQLAIECVEPSPSCYAAVGNSLSAQLLLFADLTWVRNKKKGARHVQLSVTLFDVGSSTVRSELRQSWPTEAAAIGECAHLVDQIVHARGSVPRSAQARANR